MWAAADVGPAGAATPVEVLIVDDQEPFRAVARTVVGLTPGFRVAGEVLTAEDALLAVDPRRPSLVLMDINLPGMSGIEATRLITSAYPDTTVLLVSSYSARDLPADAFTCGAAGYLRKEDFDPEAITRVWEHHQSGRGASR
jgi:DNA-binding NarL/FixJ family response regulator